MKHEIKIHWTFFVLIVKHLNVRHMIPYTLFHQNRKQSPNIKIYFFQILLHLVQNILKSLYMLTK